VGHPGEVQSKDKVVRAKGIHKVLNGLDTPLWVTNNKAIFAQSFQAICWGMILQSRGAPSRRCTRRDS
jgi:hypothetical protein